MPCRLGPCGWRPNIDSTLPTDKGVAPGNGALVGAVRQAVHVDPVVVGKPHTPLYELSLSVLATGIDRTLAIGIAWTRTSWGPLRPGWTRCSCSEVSTAGPTWLAPRSQSVPGTSLPICAPCSCRTPTPSRTCRIPHIGFAGGACGGHGPRRAGYVKEWGAKRTAARRLGRALACG